MMTIDVEMTVGKRGPKRRHGRREPRTGDLSRRPADVATRQRDAMDREQRDTISVATEARERVWGVPRHLVRDQMAGSVVGRLCLTGAITRQQYDAAIAWVDLSDAYRWAICAPRRVGAVDLNRVLGNGNAPEHIAASLAARRRYEAASAAVQAAQIELRGSATLFAALQYIVMDDRDLPHMVPDLRCALNAVARHIGTPPIAIPPEQV